MSRWAGVALTVGMLVASNLFMTLAWYWHLRPAKEGAKPWPLVAIILTSWLIALVEYCIALPRRGSTSRSSRSSRRSSPSACSCRFSCSS